MEHYIELLVESRHPSIFKQRPKLKESDVGMLFTGMQSTETKVHVGMPFEKQC